MKQDLEERDSDEHESESQHKTREGKHRHHHHHKDDDDSENDSSVLGDLAFELLFYAAYGLFIGPENDPSETFTSYPYDDPNEGQYTFNAERSSGGQYDFKYSEFRASNELQAQEYQGKIRLFPRWGLNLHLQNLVQDDEELIIWNAMAEIYRIRHEAISFYWQIGLETIDTNTGFAYGMGFNYYPGNRWSVNSDFKWGTIKEGFSTFTGTTEIAYHIYRFAISAGYKYQDLNHHIFHGPMIGVKTFLSSP